MPSPTKPKQRKSIAFGFNENADTGSSTGRKRAKSLGVSDDVTLPMARKRRTDGPSRIPTAPRSILKASNSAYDDNHTVIGVMQVALKEEPTTRPPMDRNRRVSFAPEATLHTFDISPEDIRSFSAESAASTPQQGVPFADSSAQEKSAVFYRMGSASPLRNSPLINRTPPRALIQDFVQDENDSEVEMEDVTDVFEDEFDTALVSADRLETKPLVSPGPSQDLITTTFFSPLSARKESEQNMTTNDDSEGDDEGDTQAMDVTTAIGNTYTRNHMANEDEDEEDANNEETMDVTKAVGWIEDNAEEQPMDMSTVGDLENGDDITSTGVMMDITMAVGSIQSNGHPVEEEEDVTGVTIDITRAIGSIQPKEEADDEDDAGVTMDITRAIGSIQPEEAARQEEDDTLLSVPMDLTVAVGKLEQSPVAKIHSPVISTQSPVVNQVGTPLSNRKSRASDLVGTPQSVRSLKRESSFTIGHATPTRLSFSANPAITSTANMESPKASPCRRESFRRKSLVDEKIPLLFDGQNVTIGTPDGQKLKNDINKTLFTFSTSSLQKRIQSLTPKKASRTPVRLPVNSSRQESLEFLKSEEQQALTKIYSPLKAVSSALSPVKASMSKPVPKLNHLDAPVLNLQQAINTHALSPKPADRRDVAPEDEFYEPLSLNDFLRMASVQFLEGLNTKRRNTKFFPQQPAAEASFSATVLAKYLEYPALELFEFSCKELRKNIEEGNDLFERLESETIEENPQLFRRYVQSSLDSQAAFCAQFKVIKSFSRLQAKGIWYEWRSKLFDGILGTLAKNITFLKEDCANLAKLEETVEPTVADIKVRHSEMRARLEQLKKRKNDAADCDQEELMIIREKVSLIEPDCQEKRKVKTGLVEEDGRLSVDISAITGKIQETQSAMPSLEQVIEDNRGIDTGTIQVVKNEIHQIGQLFKWEIKAITDNFLVLKYDGELELEIDLQTKAILRVGTCSTESSQVDEFFLRIMRNISDTTALGRKMQDISLVWQQCKYLKQEIDMLSSSYITAINLDDDSLTARSEILIAKSRTKIVVTYALRTIDENSAVILCEPCLEVVYGKTDKKGDYLPRRLEMSQRGLLQKGCDDICL
ncbi:Spc7 kinetochore protein-domain-containing protein [Lipomyces arxii]|uniref:Spc7 kinetochore protein-domain-containing protein n=1 Tax=Lipomyces arxii TaxID=56418 RepID=UPI0034CDFAE8